MKTDSDLRAEIDKDLRGAAHCIGEALKAMADLTLSQVESAGKAYHPEQKSMVCLSNLAEDLMEFRDEFERISKATRNG